MEISHQPISLNVYESKYKLDNVDTCIEDTYMRVAKALSKYEIDNEFWCDEFYWAMCNGATPGGRILANAGAQNYKPNTSLINCVVSSNINDSIDGIMTSLKEAGITLSKGSGIGYCFSTLRPKDGYINGVGAVTSGSLSFMDIFDKACSTINSSGGRRGAQMATHFCWHPDIEDFITSKQKDGRFRQFNLSVLITDEFIEKLKNDEDWELYFPLHKNEKAYNVKYKPFPITTDSNYIVDKNGLVLCKIYKTIKSKYLWDLIMKNTYEFSEPGVLFYDRINSENNNWKIENLIASNPCGEQPLPEYGNCLLGSINLTKFISEDSSKFNFDKFEKVCIIFSRMLDNVNECSNLAFKKQKTEALLKRRHGMGFYGLGSTLALLGISYGSEQALELAETITKIMMLINYESGAMLAKEKGPALIFNDKLYQITDKDRQKFSLISEEITKNFDLTKDHAEFKVFWLLSDYMVKFYHEFPDIWYKLLEHGCRFTHATTIPPTGTTALSIGNNASNGIEPSFMHEYSRNVIVQDKKSKEQVEVYSYEFLVKNKDKEVLKLPNFRSAMDISTDEHLLMQSTVQKWIDSSISKTINVSENISFEDFKNVYLKAYELKLKGCTTYRINRKFSSGVLINKDDFKNTKYKFTTVDGNTYFANGDETIFYDGQTHNVANLYEALKENYY